jgi:hypothetical protein
VIAARSSSESIWIAVLISSTVLMRKEYTLKRNCWQRRVQDVKSSGPHHHIKSHYGVRS